MREVNLVFIAKLIYIYISCSHARLREGSFEVFQEGLDVFDKESAFD